MNNKLGITRVLALVFCFYLIFSLPLAFIRADGETKDYKKDDDDDTGVYYIVDNKKAVKDLFDWNIYDVVDVLDWAFDFQTFTVIKSMKDENGETKYKVYFNTPNVQMLAKNQITQNFADGYKDNTYNPDENEWLVNVGSDASAVNVMTKYGFDIPNYTYWGEYPQENMTLAGVMPTSWLGKIWRFIKSLFGYSYVKAPDADNYNTITYYNHGYEDNSAYLVEYLKKYYIPMFVRKVALTSDILQKQGDDYFTDPSDVLSKLVTKEQYDIADKFCTDHYSDYYTALNDKSAYQDRFRAEQENYNFVVDSFIYSPQTGRYPNPFYLMEDTKNFDVEKANMVGATRSNNNTSGALNFLTSNAAYVKAVYNWIYPNGDAYENVNLDKLAFVYLCVKSAGADSQFDITGPFNNNPEQQVRFNQAVISAFNGDLSVEQGRAKLNVLFNALVTDPHFFESIGSFYMHTGTDLNASSSDDPLVSMDNRANQLPSNVYYIPDGDGVNVNVKGEVILDFFKSNLYACFYNWTEDDWVTEEQKMLIKEYDEQQVIIDNYELFCKLMGQSVTYRDENGNTIKYDPNSKTGIPCIAYNQCLIKDSDDDCTDSKYGAETTLSVAEVYVYSGLWEITKQYTEQKVETYAGQTVYTNPNTEVFEDYDVLTDKAVVRIINTIKNYTGPYYTDVMSNMVKLMIQCGVYDHDEKPKLDIYKDDPRVMPFDVDTMTLADKLHYQTTDPRVKIFKQEILSQFVAWDHSYGIDLSLYIAPQKTVLGWTSKITEISVFMQQIMSFEVFDAFGLSPTTMWQGTFLAVCMCILAILFVLSTAIKFIKMGDGSFKTIIAGFLVLVLELGFFLMLAADPDGIWTKIKNIDNMFIFLGEQASVYNDEDLTYLFGENADHMEVTYYLPYLDSWSKYNTGYGLLEGPQIINPETDKAELEKIVYPTLGSNEIKHWSVMLIDSFNYYGDSHSALTSIAIPVLNKLGGPTYVNGEQVFKNVNGFTINNNAYRVVDHFMAPRVHISETSDGKLSLSVTQNENYNGEFQAGMIDLFVKLLNAILMCLFSLMKLLTFVWQWFMFYIFIFKVLLAKGAENKSWGQIAIETLSPTLCLVILGIMAGIFMLIGMTLEGLLGIFVEIVLFILVFKMLGWWHDLHNGLFFPRTLVPLYYVTNMRQAKQRRAAQNMRNKSDQIMRDAGLQEGMTIDEQTDTFFTESSMLRNEFRPESITPYKKKALEDWYDHVLRIQDGEYDGRKGVRLSEKTRRAKESFENSMDPEYIRTLQEKTRSTYKKNRQSDDDDDSNGGTWRCSNCGHVNKSFMKKCEKCGMPADQSKGEKGAKKNPNASNSDDGSTSDAPPKRKKKAAPKFGKINKDNEKGNDEK